ncbi:MAG: TonB-dependent hemoglobin/transferrin/lactoferrin family receptor [Cardiobacteriaceae bacterium]|nr:TonB-dependent hemoglobin/transferrin/lactoferrin family receptor [Cardiobacteriaceae bacterium]
MPARSALPAAILAAIASAHAQNIPADAVPVELDTITVSVSREDSPLAKLAGNITVIGEDNREKALHASVEDTLADIPGVSFDRAGRYGLSDVTIRGVSGNRVKILVDGQPVTNQFSFGPFQNAGRQYTDLNNIGQIEVIKGPASSLHGSDAIGGVVSLVSKTADDYLDNGQTIGGRLFAQYSGKNNGATASATLAFAPHEQWDGLVSYAYQQSDETRNHSGINIPGNQRTAPDPQDDQSHSLAAQLRYRPNANHTLTLSASTYRDQRDTNVQSQIGNSAGQYTYHRYHGHDTQKRDAIALRHDFQLASPIADSGYWRFHSQQQKATQITDLDATTRAGAPAKRQRDSQYAMRDTGLEAQLSKNIAGTISQDWIYGLSLSQQSARMDRYTEDTIAGNSKNGHEKNAPNSTIRQIGLFAQNRLTFGTSGFSLIPGARYDHYQLDAKPDTTFRHTVGNAYQVRDYNEGQLSLRLGALYDLNDSHTLYANYAEGFRAPAFNETNLGFENASQGYAFVANPDLQPEKSRGLELGWRSDNGIFSHDLAAYYTRYHNFIQTQTSIGKDPHTGLLAFTSTNLPSAEIYGIELAGGVQLGGLAPALDGLSAHLSAAWADGKNRANNAPLSSLTPLTGHIRLDYDHPGGQWGISQKLHFASGKKTRDISDPAIAPVGGYGVWDINAYWKPVDKLTARAGIFNLLDKKYLPWNDARGISDAATRERHTAPGRWIGASFRYDL